jgi:hypothetical protein
MKIFTMGRSYHRTSRIRQLVYSWARKPIIGSGNPNMLLTCHPPHILINLIRIDAIHINERQTGELTN